MKTKNKYIIIPDFLIVLKIISSEPNQSVTKIQLKSKITYSHIHDMKKVLEEEGYITIEKEGISNVINITEKGKRIVEATNKLFETLDITSENMLEFRRLSKIKKNKCKNDKCCIKEPVILEEDKDGGENNTTQE